VPVGEANRNLVDLYAQRLHQAAEPTQRRVRGGGVATELHGKRAISRHQRGGEQKYENGLAVMHFGKNIIRDAKPVGKGYYRAGSVVAGCVVTLVLAWRVVDSGVGGRIGAGSGGGEFSAA